MDKGITPSLLAIICLISFLRFTKGKTSQKTFIYWSIGTVCYLAVGMYLINESIPNKVCGHLELEKKNCKVYEGNRIVFTKGEKELVFKLEEGLDQGEAYLIKNKENLKKRYEEL